MGNEPTITLGNKQGRRTLDRLGGFSTSIGVDSTFQGSLSGEGHCIILGRVEGDSVLHGMLVIAESGHWVGDIEAKNVVIAGQVEGAIVAHKKLELVSSARITGSLTSPNIAIAEGAIHDGEIHMAGDIGKVKHFADQRGEK